MPPCRLGTDDPPPRAYPPQAVYTVLREAEYRSVNPIPYWNIPVLGGLVPRQQRCKEALKVINTTLDELVARCKVWGGWGAFAGRRQGHLTTPLDARWNVGCVWGGGGHVIFLMPLLSCLSLRCPHPLECWPCCPPPSLPLPPSSGDGGEGGRGVC